MTRFIYFVLLTIVIINVANSKLHNYENFDADAVIFNPARSKKFFDCVNNEELCTKEDKELKMDVLEMFTTNCKNCTEKEKKNFETVKMRVMSDPNIMKMAMGDHGM
ncbi:insect pheromone-binding family, a10/OS-D domain-containing protein [Phthorimaea operculella]|nr:insect pheromone-binding family, a10/OS-D domain-containing protein [Phthorimaea operculella]